VQCVLRAVPNCSVWRVCPPPPWVCLQILSLLNNATGNVLDDENLINALSASKSTSNQVKDRVAAAAKTQRKLQTMREVYQPVAIRGCSLYFCLADLALVEPMYQFSLDWFNGVFRDALASTKVPPAEDAAAVEGDGDGDGGRSPRSGQHSPRSSTSPRSASPRSPRARSTRHNRVRTCAVLLLCSCGLVACGDVWERLSFVHVIDMSMLLGRCEHTALWHNRRAP